MAIEPGTAWDSELERRQRLVTQADPRAHSGFAAELVVAADQFIITPTTRVADAARAHAAGDEIRSVIAGYHWFTDWGRDTMISLEGLTLATGRQAEAGQILRTFGHYVHHGLIPNLFPEGRAHRRISHGRRHALVFRRARSVCRSDRRPLDAAAVAADAPRYRRASSARHAILASASIRAMACCGKGPRATNSPGWTPRSAIGSSRRGAARRSKSTLCGTTPCGSSPIGWPRKNCSPKPSKLPLMPSSVANRSTPAFGLPTAVISSTSSTARGRTTPRCGPIRCLPFRCRIRCSTKSIGRACSRPSPNGCLRRWDCAPRRRASRTTNRATTAISAPATPPTTREPSGLGLSAPLSTPGCKVHPEQRAATDDFLAGFADHLNEACIGTIGEIFDAEAPYEPRGCTAQAWSVAEVLRCWVASSARK